MSEAAPWTADRELDTAIATRAIHEAVPDLAGCDVEPLGSGWDFDTYEAAGRFTFRFPRRDGVQRWLRKDLLLLPWLVQRVELPVPHYRWGELRAPASFPYVFSGYETLRGDLAATHEPGRDLRTRLGRRLGGFLAGMHSLSPPSQLVGGAGLDDPLVDPGPLRDHMRRHLAGFCERVPQLASRATRFFDDPDLVPAPYAGAPRLIHADLHAEHLLVDPAAPHTVTGILDWSDARIGDPARDFACIYSWGAEPMLRAMLEHYDGAGAGLEARARFLGICFTFQDWAWWVEIDNQVAARAARETLEESLPAAP